VLGIFCDVFLGKMGPLEMRSFRSKKGSKSLVRFSKPKENRENLRAHWRGSSSK
jgi:hypothetical protein